MTITATVITAAKPKAQKSCRPRTRYVVISVNIATGFVEAFDTGDLKLAKSHFSYRGDPATWRGVQIIQIDTNGGTK